MSNKLMIFRSNRKEKWSSDVKQRKIMPEKNQGLQHREGGR